MLLSARVAAGETIINIGEMALREDGINIFDPMSSCPATVRRYKVGAETRHTTEIDPVAVPMVTGPDAEERIARILKAAANLDSRFKLAE